MNDEQEFKIKAVFYRNIMNVLTPALIQEILIDIGKIIDHEGKSQKNTNTD